MLTDWSNTDPHYFYMRGALWGIVFATLFWTVVVPWIKRKLEERERRLYAEDIRRYESERDQDDRENL